MKIAIAGVSGRMGRVLVEAVLNAADMKLVGAVSRANNSIVGQDAAAFLGRHTGVNVTADINHALVDADCLIDFTRPQITMDYAAIARDKGVKLVIGTTGFDEAQKNILKEMSARIPIVLAPNTSVGVNLTFKLLELAGKLLQDRYDIEIFEAHHRHKVDAPSGTALRMGEILASTALNAELAACATYTRSGHTGERPARTIGFSTMRGGDIVGEHTVVFAGLGERIEISHQSSNRQSYAEGALQAARFLQQQSKGLFDMQDVLHLR